MFHFGHLNDQQLYDQKSTCAKPIEQSLCGFAFITLDYNLISFINFRLNTFFGIFYLWIKDKILEYPNGDIVMKIKKLIFMNINNDHVMPKTCKLSQDWS